LERIEESAFSQSGLKSIEIPSSVVLLGKKSFYQCESLESVTFESGSRLERINKSMFEGRRVSFGSVSGEFMRIRRSSKPEKQSEERWSYVSHHSGRARRKK
jgi:hypothetical protein